MLDHNPLQPIPGAQRPTDSDDPDAFVAKLRYQQTKVDGIIPTILVEQAIVNVITEQQRWVAATHPHLQPKYLFIGVKQNLARLDKLHGLTDAAGNPLQFSKTHRLRHTRATELLNNGVPIHVVQRYLGHKSPEMTPRYTATLAVAADAEFLNQRRSAPTGSTSRSAPPTSST